MDGFRENKLFGAVICDVCVPDNKNDQFAETPPIYKNVEITNQDVGEYMKDLYVALDEFKTPLIPLISSYFGKNIMLTSSLLQWYLLHGLIVENITAFVQYKLVACLELFSKEVAEA